MMNKSIFTIAAAVLAIVAGSTALAQPEIKSATYTITQVKQYNIQVVRIIGRSLTVDVEGFGRRRFQVPRDFTFDIDGETKTLNQIIPGQKLRAYVTETETGELLLVQDQSSTDGVVGENVTDEENAEAAESAPQEEAAASESEPAASEPDEPAPEPDSAAVPEPDSDDRLAQASFESPPGESPLGETESAPVQLPATADNRGWMAIVGGTLVIAGFGVGWHRRSERQTMV